MISKIGTIVAASATGLAAGVFAVTAVASASASDNAPKTPDFPTNAKGQTYGSAAGLLPDQEPDLISAYADDGKTKGYVLRDDLESYPATQAESAKFVARDSKPRPIPVFDLSGTRIGTHTIPASHGQSFTEGNTPEFPSNP